MFDAYTKFFKQLEARNVLIREQLGSDAEPFAVLLRNQPRAHGPALGRRFETYLQELIRYGLENSATRTHFFRFLKSTGILQYSAKRSGKIVLRPSPSTVKLSAKDVAEITKALATAADVAKKLQPVVTDQPVRPVVLRQPIDITSDAPVSGVIGSGAPAMKSSRRPVKQARPTPAKYRARSRATPPGAPPLPNTPASPMVSTKPSREIKVTGHKPDGSQVATFSTGEEYRLRFSVGSPVAQNLATGDTAIQNVPQGGLSTRWVLTSTEVEFVNAPATIEVQKYGNCWLAEFDLLIPEEGESDTRTLAIKAVAGSAQMQVTIYAVSGATREIYREISVRLDGAPVLAKDETVKAPLHVHLETTHEWTTPGEHIQINIVNGLAIVSTRKLGPVQYDFYEPFSATDILLSNAINNVRDSLEQLRETHSDYLDDLDATDLSSRLDTGNWRPPYSFYQGWSPLPEQADPPHKAAFGQVQASKEWRALASDGYELFNSCFPKGRKLRALLEQLVPGSRVDFHWTQQSGPGFVSHVPWALMYMEEVGVSGPEPDPEKFLGLHFRIGTRSWDVNNGSVAVGNLDTTFSMDLLYWGNQAGDDVADEARWQASEYKKWKWSRLLPDPALPDPKGQLTQALEQPFPPPVGVVYFYCQCSVGNGAQPVLRFGNTSKPPDTLSRTDLSQRSLPDGPLVFANACTTSQSDPHMTSELEQRFFGRGIRAFIGTETKVPTRLASKFAWLYFQFLYRRADRDFKPMSAGEALTQARMFLWTQYKNVGGLFYSLTNQYDLYFASNEEVLALRP